MVVSIFGQQMPAEHGELACHGDRRDLVATPGSDTQEERAQRSWRLGGSPRRLDQHGACVATTALADAAMLGQTKTRLAHPRIEPDIAHELLRRGEAADVADRGDEACGHDDVDAGDGQQALDGRVLDQIAFTCSELATITRAT